jgi:hypothetical protein
MRLAAGLHRIGSYVVNSYLVEGPAGITIIDAGLRRPPMESCSNFHFVPSSVDQVGTPRRCRNVRVTPSLASSRPEREAVGLHARWDGVGRCREANPSAVTSTNVAAVFFIVGLFSRVLGPIGSRVSAPVRNWPMHWLNCAIESVQRAEQLVSLGEASRLQGRS